MKNFIAGMVTALFLISMVNCSGTLPKKSGGMRVIQHGSPVTQEKVPCDCSKQ